MDERLVINQKELSSKDEYKVISIRISEEDLKHLDKLADKTNRSRNSIINKFIEYSLDHYTIRKRDAD